MYNHNNRYFARYLIIATIILIAGLFISFQFGGTWWLLVMAIMAWGQALILQREIVLSGLIRRLFNTLSWTLLGFAGVSLLPLSARIVCNVVILFIALASLIGIGTRRVR